MTVTDILEEWLKEHGFDGLYNDDAGCACLTGNLAPCCGDPMVCRPGYKVKAPSRTTLLPSGIYEPDGYWTVRPDKPTRRKKRKGS